VCVYVRVCVFGPPPLRAFMYVKPNRRRSRCKERKGGSFASTSHPVRIYGA
jgi:hypothetical protein